jgi:tRNA 2-thiouridine synthesizing protein E
MEKIIAGKTVNVNDEGYMTDLNQWAPEIANEMAKEVSLDLSPRHFEVLTFLQNQFKAEVPLTIRKVGSSGVVDIKEFYALFPNGPLKISSKLAGIPKPASCI